MHADSPHTAESIQFLCADPTTCAYPAYVSCQVAGAGGPAPETDPRWITHRRPARNVAYQSILQSGQKLFATVAHTCGEVLKLQVHEDPNQNCTNAGYMHAVAGEVSNGSVRALVEVMSHFAARHVRAPLSNRYAVRHQPFMW